MDGKLYFGKARPDGLALCNTRDRLVTPMRPVGGMVAACTSDRLMPPRNPSTRTQDRLPVPSRPQEFGTHKK